MAIWAISASPLIMGNDLRKVSEESKAVLLNKEAVAVSQDPLGKMGRRHPSFASESPVQVWSRPLANGDVAVGLYNKNNASKQTVITVNFRDLNLFGNVSVFDIWANRNLGNFEDSFTAKNVGLHDTVFLRVAPLTSIVV